MFEKIPQKNKDAGFTLIELLVVVAIIGLLASIILVSLEDSRDKAKNSKKNQMVMQYINALELYRSENSSIGYPDWGQVTGSYPNSYCLGEEVEESCQSDDYTGNDILNGLLEKFITGTPADDISVPGSTARGNPTDYKGISYACADSNNIENDGDCNSYNLEWFLIGSNQDCIRDAVRNIAFTGITKCTYEN